MYFTLGSAGAGLVLAPLMSRIAVDISWRWSWVGIGLIFLGRGADGLAFRAPPA